MLEEELQAERKRAEDEERAKRDEAEAKRIQRQQAYEREAARQAEVERAQRAAEAAEAKRKAEAEKEKLRAEEEALREIELKRQRQEARNADVRRIQSLAQGWKAKKAVRETSMTQCLEAVTRLQAAFVGNEMQRMVQWRCDVEARMAARRIKAGIRGWISRRDVPEETERQRPEFRGPKQRGAPLADGACSTCISLSAVAARRMKYISDYN